MRCDCDKAGHSSCRTGFNLIEMLVVMSVMGVLLSLGVVLLGLLMRVDTAGHNALSRQMSLARLEQQFRADAHAAVAAKPSEDAQTLELRFDDEHGAKWLISKAGVERRVLDGESVAARNDFQLPNGESQFRVDSSGRMVELQRIELRGTPTRTPADESVVPGQTWRIRAALGLAVAAPEVSGASDAESEQ